MCGCATEAIVSSTTSANYIYVSLCMRDVRMIYARNKIISVKMRGMFFLRTAPRRNRAVSQMKARAAFFRSPISWVTDMLRNVGLRCVWRFRNVSGYLWCSLIVFIP